jgi:magnesium-transporting ATPase (P-type)
LLITPDKKLTGDPIELLFFEGAEWTYTNYDKTARSRRGNKSARILSMYPFSSDLKRMSTIVHWEQESDNLKIKEIRGLCKGAPEVI